MRHAHDLGAFGHSHAFADAGRARRAAALTLVTALTLAAMVLELGVGWWTGSLALTADGWHMGLHALALGGAVLAYRLADRAAAGATTEATTPAAPAAAPRPGFAFGGWKIEVLAAYTSGLALLAVAAWLVWEGVQTLLSPRPVAYGEALVVAVVGLAVNLASVVLLARGGSDGHGHHHEHDHGHAHGLHRSHDHGGSHGHHHGDHHGDHPHHPHHPQHAHHRPHPEAHAPGAAGRDANFSAAYVHVLADALTSLLAIAALAGGAWWGWAWLDPAVALLGAVVIGRWSFSVLRTSAGALVDQTEDPRLASRVRAAIESDGDAQLADLHVWQVGSQAWCAALTVVADRPLAAAAYRDRLQAVPALRHVTIEVHPCIRCPATPADRGGDAPVPRHPPASPA